MGGGASHKFKKAARKIFVQTCVSFCQRQQQQSHVVDPSSNVTCDSPNDPSPSAKTTERNLSCKKTDSTTSPSSDKNLCSICLDPLNYSSGSSPGQAIFTAECSHAFHFACISSNVHHGSLTCPVCRAYWTQPPRNLTTHHSKTDPILRILDDSIANFRVHRRSVLHTARYDDDDPIETNLSMDQPRLHLSLLPEHATDPGFNTWSYQSSQSNSSSCPLLVAESPHNLPSNGEESFQCYSKNRAYLQVKLARRPATDLVLVASPNGPHLRPMKQCMASLVSSLQPTDRLAIVTYSSAAARAFPLRLMTPNRKRRALQVIDRLFNMGQADPIEGLKKGVKILEDRLHENSKSCILHLTDSPSRSCHSFELDAPVMIHRFDVGFRFATSSRFVTHEFEEFLARTLGNTVREVQLRIGDSESLRIRELRNDEERRIPLCLNKSGHVCVEYSFVDGSDAECVRTGKVVLGLDDKGGRDDGENSLRSSSVEGWDYHDPFMARRWAKHLPGYRL